MARGDFTVALLLRLLPFFYEKEGEFKLSETYEEL